LLIFLKSFKAGGDAEGPWFKSNRALPYVKQTADAYDVYTDGVIGGQQLALL
jgi:hypothetical protein